MLAGNADRNVVEGFGDEWSRLDQSALASAERQELFDAYFADPRAMPEGWREGLDRAEDRVKARYAADFLAGMTDTYALKEHRRLFDHTPDFS